MNIAIIGAGLTGRLLAWQMLELGHSVSLYDKDSGDGECSAGIIAAAMLAPFSEVLDAEPEVYHQGLAGFPVWQRWQKSLLASTGIDIGLQLQGSVVVSHRNDEGDFQRFWQRLQAHGDVDKSCVQAWNKNNLLEHEPELAVRFDKACYLQQEGCLDNAALFLALQNRIKQLGGVWHTGQSVNFPAFAKKYSSQFEWIIDCRGYGAASELSGLRGVRGEVIRVRAPEVNLTRPVRLMHPRYKLYIAPKPDHEYIIGATQIESSLEHAITVRSSLELLSALYSVHSGFAEAEIMLQSARCRPAFDDHLPRIVVQNRTLAVNGLFRHGYLLSPVVILQVMEVLAGSKPAVWPAIVSGETLPAGRVA